MSLPATAQPCTFILTADRARSLPFYTGVLGLALLAQDDFAATLDAGNGTPLRLTTHAGWVAQPHTMLGWNVTDIRAAMAALIAKGVTFKVYEGFGQDTSGVWSTPDGGAHVAWFADPDGNILSLTQFGEQ